MGKGLYTAEQFIKAIPGTGGIITAIARKVGCEWNTAKRYIEEYPTIKQAYDNECESMLDMAETELFKAVKSGKDWAIKYTLATKGKKRGYVERAELTGPGGGQIEQRITVTDDSILRKLLPELTSDGTQGAPKPAE
jgi:hypothetical protein